MVRLALLSLAAIVAGVTLGHAAYDPFPLRDPTRHWSVSVTASEGYDDNINTTSSGAERSSTTAIEPELLVNFLQEQTFLGLRYTYGATYFAQRIGTKVDQAHTADILFSHTFSSRLTLDAQDQVRRGVEPGLVEIQAGVPVELRRKGDYAYNNAGTTLSYDLTQRWTTSVSAGWQLWRYDDLDSYYTKLLASFALTRLTFVGAQYQYERTDYRLATFAFVPPFFFTSISAKARSSQSNIGSLVFVQRFNPQLSLRATGGLELREYGDGTASTAPSVEASLTYNYGPEDAVTAGFNYSLSTSDLAQFRDTAGAVLYLQASHRITAKFRTTAKAVLSYATYQNPTVFIPPPTPQNATSTSIELGLSLMYAVTPWCTADVGYTYDTVNSDFAGSSFDRNRASLGVRVTY